MKSILPILFAFISISFALAQDEYPEIDTNAVGDHTPKVRDTVSFPLKFVKGDTLVYFVESADSIVIDYGDPLLKLRRELLQVVCVDVTKEKDYILKLQLIDFQSKEVQSDNKEVERKSSPWIGRYVLLTIDSSGSRKSFKMDDTTNAAASPGSFFAPYLFFPFKETRKPIDASWTVKSLDLLPENGFPYAALNQASLFQAMNPVDTLGYACNRISFVKTAQGSFYMTNPEMPVTMTNIINGYGEYTISKEYNVPVHFTTTLEQKLRVKSGEEDEQAGYHYISSFYTLVEFNRKRKI